MKRFNKILSGFNKTIDKLTKLEDKMIAKDELKTDKIKALKAECIEHEAEALAARNVADKLRDLIGNDK